MPVWPFHLLAERRGILAVVAAAAVGAQSRVDAHDAVVNERERERVAGKQTVRCYQVENRLGVREGQRAALLRAKKLLIERRTRHARKARA